jgi:hypothetical protein
MAMSESLAKLVTNSQSWLCHVTSAIIQCQGFPRSVLHKARLNGVRSESCYTLVAGSLFCNRKFADETDWNAMNLSGLITSKMRSSA